MSDTDYWRRFIELGLGLLVYGLAIIGAGALIGLLTGVIRFEDLSEPTPVSVMVVITTTPENTPAPTSTSTPTPTPPVVPVRHTPVVLVAATNTPAPSSTPAPTATFPPTYTPVPTMTPNAPVVAVEPATSTPTITPTIAPPALVCGYAEIVLIGAGKKHKPCHTPTPTALGVYNITTVTPERKTVPTSTPIVVSKPIPTQTPIATSTSVTTPTSSQGVVVEATLTPYLKKLFAELTPVKPDIDIRELEDRIYELVNVERLEHGMRSLDHVREVRLIARSHSEDMLTRDYFAHESPQGFGPMSRSEQAQYKCPMRSSYGLAENIALIALHAGYIDRDGEMDIQTWITLEGLALRFVHGWMNSKGHRANILTSSYNSTGVGVAISEDYKVYGTQNFC